MLFRSAFQLRKFRAKIAITGFASLRPILRYVDLAELRIMAVEGRGLSDDFPKFRETESAVFSA